MRIKTDLATVPVGKNFKVWGREYTKLAGNDKACLVLQANDEGNMPFQRDTDREDQNNFAKSEIREWLENEYIQLLRGEGMKDGDVLPMTVDLKCPLGQHEYGSVVVMAGLLTAEQYGEFYDIIPKDVDDWWWLATPWHTPGKSPCGATHALLVYTYGTWGISYCSCSYGIRPALNLSQTLMVSWECGDDEQEENAGGCDFCQNFDFGTVSATVETFSSGKQASIRFSGGSSRFSAEKQFSFCPCCGKRLNSNTKN